MNKMKWREVAFDPKFNLECYLDSQDKRIEEKDKEIEQLKNTIHEIEEYTHERIKLYKKTFKISVLPPYEDTS